MSKAPTFRSKGFRLETKEPKMASIAIKDSLKVAKPPQGSTGVFNSVAEAQKGLKGRLSSGLGIKKR